MQSSRIDVLMRIVEPAQFILSSAIEPADGTSDDDVNDFFDKVWPVDHCLRIQQLNCTANLDHLQGAQLPPLTAIQAPVRADQRTIASAERPPDDG